MLILKATTGLIEHLTKPGMFAPINFFPEINKWVFQFFYHIRLLHEKYYIRFRYVIWVSNNPTFPPRSKPKSYTLRPLCLSSHKIKIAVENLTTLRKHNSIQCTSCSNAFASSEQSMRVSPPQTQFQKYCGCFTFRSEGRTHLREEEPRRGSNQ
ncbi:hypothetical protein CEXT_670221 [Caerostris extrusa]|uniref:Uncharacterized protein n=1 Tax=Caerostris extrusa TaxID=172846 RepID=A0AAV4P4I7_CAEEX|nr:hypothetical protein CEXT_670221 [Caerostris extrusa]